MDIISFNCYKSLVFIWLSSPHPYHHVMTITIRCKFIEHKGQCCCCEVDPSSSQSYTTESCITTHLLVLNCLINVIRRACAHVRAQH